jgi:hypothetical protein
MQAPEELKSSLPTIEEIEAELEDVVPNFLIPMNKSLLLILLI